MQNGIFRVVISGFLLFGCSDGSGLFQRQKTPDTQPVLVAEAGPDVMRPKPRPTGDTAIGTGEKPVPVARPEQDLGETVVSLGLLDRGGLWLRTPLVKSEVKGRVVYEQTGTAANVLLLPLQGESSAGSQLSLAAMQVLGIPLVELAKVRVFVR